MDLLSWWLCSFQLAVCFFLLISVALDRARCGGVVGHMKKNSPDLRRVAFASVCCLYVEHTPLHSPFP